MRKSLAAKLNARIQAVMQTEDWLGAIELVQNHSETVQSHWELSWNLGWAYFKLDRFKEARKYLLTAVRLAPENPVCHWSLGIVRRSLGNHKAAEVALKRALRIRDSYLARIALALTYMDQDKLDEAEDVHLEGLRLKPTAERYKAYADFLSDVGREDEAQRIYRKARRLRANSIDRRTGAQKLLREG